MKTNMSMMWESELKMNALYRAGSAKKRAWGVDEPLKKGRSVDSTSTQDTAQWDKTGDVLTYVIENGGAKDESCVGRLKVADDHTPNNTDTASDNYDCDIDGYIMYKNIKSTKRTGRTGIQLRETKEQDHEVTLPENSVLETCTLKSLSKALKDNNIADTPKDRENFFISKKAGQISQNIDRMCIIYPNKIPQLGITYDKFGEELSSLTDWYFDNDDACIFVRLVIPDDEEALEDDKKIKIDEPYLYIILVCRGGSRRPKMTISGKMLIEAVEILAQKLGVHRVVLSALPTVVAYYYHLGFRFMSREGDEIDVNNWVVESETGEKLTGPTLRW
jgi:hypothetical protein